MHFIMTNVTTFVQLKLGKTKKMTISIFAIYALIIVMYVMTVLLVTNALKTLDIHY